MSHLLPPLTKTIIYISLTPSEAQPHTQPMMLPRSLVVHKKEEDPHIHTPTCIHKVSLIVKCTPYNRCTHTMDVPFTSMNMSAPKDHHNMINNEYVINLAGSSRISTRYMLCKDTFSPHCVFVVFAPNT